MKIRREVNTYIEYILVGAFVLFGSYLAYDYAINDAEIIFTSQYDKIESEKKQARELLTIIDLLDSPLRLDVLNTGEDEIAIKKLYVDGILDESYTINGIQTNIIPLDEMTVIYPTDTTGNTIKIITENNNEYDLGE